MLGAVQKVQHRSLQSGDLNDFLSSLNFVKGFNGHNYMNIDLIFQIAGVGIVVAVLNQLLVRAGREEQALLTTIAGLVVVLFMIVGEIGSLFDTIKQTFNF